MINNMAAKIEIMKVLVKYGLIESDAVSTLKELLDEINR
jgi:hypothetical protein